MKNNLTFECQNFQSFICNIDNFEEIKNIHLSQKRINGIEKNGDYNKKFEFYITHILEDVNSNRYVVGSRDRATGKMTGYSIIFLPEASCFSFYQFGEVPKTESSVFAHTLNGYVLFRLAMGLGELDGKFDMFWSARSNNVLSELRIIKNRTLLDKDPPRYNFCLNSILPVGKDPITPIQKALIRNVGLERNYDAAILHASLKPEYRLPYFETYLGTRKKS